METREWKTIKEYQDILFDFSNAVRKTNVTGVKKKFPEINP